MSETEEYLVERYNAIMKGANEKGELSQSAYEHLSAKPLNTLDELDEAYAELIHFLQNAAYYKLLERIEKGEKMRDEETDKSKREYYTKILASLYAELEKLIPKEDAA